MATEEQRRMLDRRAQSGVSIPVLEMPKIPERFKRRPEDREAWEQLERAFDRWRKTLGTGGTQFVGVANQGNPGGGGSGGNQGGGPPVIPPPQVEADLHALYLMQFTWD